MASRAKSNKPRSTRGKPAPTIDLKAKEVAAQTTEATEKKVEADTSTIKETSTAAKPPEPKTAEPKQEQEKSSNNRFGRQNKSEGTKPADPKSAAKPSSKQPEAKSGSGFGGMIFSALLGGAATVAGLGAIGQVDGADKLPLIGSLYASSQESNSNSANSSQIENLQAQIDRLSANQQSIVTTDVDLAPIAERLTAVETVIAELPESGAEKFAELESRLENLSGSLSEMASVTSQAGDSATNPQLAAALADIGSRLANMESQVANVQSATSTSDALSETITRVDNLENGLANLGAQEIPNLAPITEQVAALEQSTANLLDTVEKNSQALQILQEKSTQIDEQIESAKSSQKVARSVALNALGTSLENGDGLSISVASIATLVGETPETKRLGELAEKGIASVSELQSGFEQFTDQARVETAAPQNDGLIASLLSSAQKLVKITPSGPISGETPEAIFSRIRAALSTGDLQAVASEWEQLPESMRQQGNGWITQVKERLEAFSLFAAISKSLSGSSG